MQEWILRTTFDATIILLPFLIIITLAKRYGRRSLPESITIVPSVIAFLFYVIEAYSLQLQ